MYEGEIHYVQGSMNIVNGVSQRYLKFFSLILKLVNSSISLNKIQPPGLECILLKSTFVKKKLHLKYLHGLASFSLALF